METVGEYLKRVRNACGYSLEDISHATKINQRYLKAIEEDDFSKLPGETFIRGFMLSYAKFLGIDEHEIIGKIEERKKIASPSIDINKVNLYMLGDKGEKIRLFLSANIKIIVAIGAGVVAIVLLIILFASDRDAESIHNSKEIREVKREAEEVQRSQVIQPVEVPLLFRIHTKELTWIQAEIDEKEIKDVLLRPGEKVLWKANNKIVMTIGNAGGIDAEIDGRPLGPFGERGEIVRNIVITSAGVSR